MKKLPSLPVIPEHEQTPVVKALLGLVEQLIERVQQQDEEIALLKDDINILICINLSITNTNLNLFCCFSNLWDNVRTAINDGRSL